MISPQADEIDELVAAAESLAHECASALDDMAVRFVELGEPGPAAALTVVSAMLGDLRHRLESRLPRVARHSRKEGSDDGGQDVFDR